VGAPNGFEIERKYLLERRPEVSLLADRGARPLRIVQVYLRPAETAAVRRIRMIDDASGRQFVYTEKGLARGIVREERESAIDEARWGELLRDADPERGPVRKTRWVFGYDGHTLELDLFESPPDLTLLEVELDDPEEVVRLPDWLGPVRDVSEDPAYTNVELARRVASNAAASDDRSPAR
jgi:CYTH domain-containing protein